jgi:cytochrome c oxidase cbb3-type subunit 2
MRLRVEVLALIPGALGLMLTAGATPCRAQMDINIHTVTGPMESHVGDVTGHSEEGKAYYRRYCIGCHGPNGDGNGENAMWFDPTMGFAKPRDFTLATFKCRSTPTGTLPTDQDLYDAVSRGFVTTNMPRWLSLTPKERADLVAFLKTFSAKWETHKAGTPINIPQEPPANVDSILKGRQLFQTMQCWKCHGPEGHGDGPSAPTLTDNKDNPIRPYNFASGSRFKCGETNQDLYRVFMTGLDGTPMPSFADVIQPNDAWDLVHFLRTLQPLDTPEAKAWKEWLTTHGKELKPIGAEEAPGGGQ